MPAGYLGWFAKVFNPVLDPVFGPLLDLPPFLAILIITFVVMLITTLIYKKVTDQELMKSLKQEMKDIQKEMKEFREDPKKLMELQKKSFEKMIQQFKHSMKPMIITLIPILIIFAWLSTNLAYYPITPDTEFTTAAVFAKDTTGTVKLSVPDGITMFSKEKQEIEQKPAGGIFKLPTAEAEWKLKGEEGSYELIYEFNDNLYVKDLIITNGKEYTDPQKIIKKSELKMIQISNQPIKVLGLSWFWSYLILAIILSTVLRKLFKVH